MKKRFLVVWLPPTYDLHDDVLTMENIMNEDDGWTERIQNIVANMKIYDWHFFEEETIYIHRIEDSE